MRREIYRYLETCLSSDRPVAVASVVGGPRFGEQLLIAPASGEQPAERVGGFEDPELERAVTDRTAELLTSFQSQRERFHVASAAEGAREVDVFIEVHAPRPKLVIIGAVHVAAALVTFAKVLGFKTHVVDPRTAFATPERFAHADELSTAWPDEALRNLGITENTFIALLSHDQKLDLPALQIALPSPARYIGALGSKKTHRKRVAALLEAGIPSEQIERIHNPIGLDLGGRRAEEIAAAILAEMIAVQHGKA
ncbi:MAG: XdhC family protein [Acidobacteriota bacterium]